MVAANSINESTTGIVGFTGTSFTASPATQYAVQIGGAASSTLSNVSVGTNGQVLIGATGAAPAFATLTSSNSTITFTPGANSLSLQAASSVPTSFTTDSGSATPASNIIKIYGKTSSANCGQTVYFSGSSDEIDFHVNDANDNITLGRAAGKTTQSGSNNCAVGVGVLANLGAASNSAGLGYLALNSVTSGDSNTGLGRSALQSVSTGVANVGVGHTALQLCTGDYNTSVGTASLAALTSGIRNTVIGYSSGSSYVSSESSNILISNLGTLGESNVMRLGTQGNGTQQVNQCYIAGIVGVTVSNTQLVTINSSTGQCGVVAYNPSGFAWTDVTGASQTLAINNGYITDRGGGVTYTLPSTASLGDTIKIVGKAGLATITPNANQQILIASTSGAVGVTGTAVSNNAGDCIELVCITAGASCVFRASSVVGTWTLTT